MLAGQSNIVRTCAPRKSGAYHFSAPRCAFIGIIFGVVYWQTGNLLTAIIAHVPYDIWALRYLNREMHRLGLFDKPDWAARR